MPQTVTVVKNFKKSLSSSFNYCSAAFDAPYMYEDRYKWKTSTLNLHICKKV